MLFFIYYLSWRENGSIHVWGLPNKFCPLRHFLELSKLIVYLVYIMFIFDMCHRSFATETPATRERVSKDLGYYLIKSKFPQMRK